MDAYYLVFDMGTGNSKIAIVSSQGKIIGSRVIENHYYRDENYPDAQYFLPQEWETRLLWMAEELLREFSDIKIDAITASGARQSVVLYDAAHVACMGLPNIDNRGRQWMDEIGGKQEIYKRTGKWVTEDFIAAKLMGFKKKYPQDFSKISKITSLSEWIGEIFCGEIFIEPSQACETQLFDIIDMQWSERICKAYGIDPRILPEIQLSGSKLGSIKHSQLQRFSLGPDVVFIIGGADTQLAAKSSQCTDGDIVIISGTTSPVVRIHEEQYYDPDERCWVDCNIGGKNYLVETNPGVTGLNYQRFKEHFLSDYSYEELEKKYAEKTGFPCTASFTSLLFSRQKSLKMGGFVMKSPFSADCDITDLAWGLLSDTACAIYNQYLSLCNMIPFERDYIRCCGGGFRSPTLCQFLADLTEKDIILLGDYSQASIIGCADVCNEYFASSRSTEDSCITYQPKVRKGIQQYYEDWNKNRLMLNE
ncbi:FGGY-family carbohydrate kinase [Sediminispirochaeta smaragdinae]|uniref:Carbohydrate kinase, FGGY n=1 Tax=Sediminispirochaeta smaragdinae (strain DSM 11293 / JCM 15392 / SEBR 4228) TaxID=573413 RepID=E1R1Y0_SEDSS|nr:FGGY family carbohydrate kinase [Sediminispirochaeta smaragdinae]ADK81506.1 Carbohydrate kinase, FGGY [Sediminispirochaeta smaragdinae DSM 11293]